MGEMYWPQRNSGQLTEASDDNTMIVQHVRKYRAVFERFGRTFIRDDLTGRPNTWAKDLNIARVEELTLEDGGVTIRGLCAESKRGRSLILQQ
jgi:hypothetical protein